ncbi:MAG: hypothetical protein OEY34_04685 [Cyclobacteriaceae bacterium]|nr:hypothetical protein [Cyclobacteriaceae bacterium]
MPKYLLFLYFLLIGFQSYSQEPSLLLRYRNGKTLKYEKGETIRFKLRDSENYIQATILNFDRDRIYFHGAEVFVSDISEIDIRHKIKYTLSALLARAAVGYFIVDAVNNKFQLNQRVFLTSAGLGALSLGSRILRKKKFIPGRGNSLYILFP